MIILFILINFSLNYVWILLGENWCSSLLALKGLNRVRVWRPRRQTLAKFPISPISAISFEVTHARTRQFVSKRLGACPRAIGWHLFLLCRCFLLEQRHFDHNPLGTIQPPSSQLRSGLTDKSWSNSSTDHVPGTRCKKNSILCRYLVSNSRESSGNDMKTTITIVIYQCLILMMIKWAQLICQ